jgi:hypothetical protein
VIGGFLNFQEVSLSFTMIKKRKWQEDFLHHYKNTGIVGI